MTAEAPAAAPARDSPLQATDLPDNRIAELDALVTFLQADNERKSSLVARKLHDEIGGSVIGAMMDVAWIEQHDTELSPDTTMRLGRVKDGLRGAIDLARRMVEELRPTLLDSVGLFAALSWQFKRGCAVAGVRYAETYPASAPEMDSTILIGLFRIAQEAFDVALRREAVSNVKLSVESTQHALTVQLTDDGKHTAAETKRDMASGPMLSVFHRVRLLNGEAVMLTPPAGGSVFRVTIPLVGNEL
ncbi:MAG: sensor histidine kinase [Steroidobacteraceae bacterium]